MKRYALLVLFLAFVLSDLLGVDLSLVTGLSVKNLLLYALVAWIVLEAALVGSAGGVLQRKYSYLPLHLAFVLLVLLAGLSVVAVLFFNMYPGYSLMYGVQGFKTFALDYYLVLFVFLAGISSSQEAMYVMRAMALMVCVACVISLIEMFGFWSFGIMTPRGDGRLQGPLGSSNDYGTLMALLIPVTWAIASSLKGARRFAWVVGLLVLVVVLLFTASRGAVIALLVGSLAAVLLMRRYIRLEQVARVLMIGSILALVGLAVLAAQYGDMLYERFVGTSIESTAFGRSSGRTQIWAEALRQMTDATWAFFIGFGWKSFDILNPIAAHSEYLEYFFNLGTFGLALMLFVHIYVVWAVVRTLATAGPDARIMASGFLVGFVAVMFANLFGNLYSVGLYLWAFSGVTLSLLRQELREDRGSGGGRHAA